MKVLQINSVCGVKSTGRLCTDIADVLEAYGHECKIAYGRETVPEKYQKYAVKIGNKFDVYLHVLKSRIFDGMGYGSKAATKKFIKWIKEYSPDIIHLHNIHGYYININILFEYLNKANIPVIWTLHDCWTFTGHCVHFKLAGCNKWKNQCENCPQKKTYPASLTDKSKYNFLKKQDLFNGVNNLTIVTPSKWLADLVMQSYFKNKKVEIINNGIDIDTFKFTDGNFRLKYNLLDKKIILGVASVWGYRKGLDDFLQLAMRLSDDYKIVLVGLNKKQLKDLPQNIIGIQRTNNIKELAHIYSAADVFLNLTYEDTYPTVNLEAQACGTPVITYRTGGSVESVNDDMVVEQGDIDAVIKKINSENLKVNKNLLIDKNDMILQYLNIYKKTQC